MAHADDATKTWVSAIPTKNSDGNVVEWEVRYRYKKNSFSHTFKKREKIAVDEKGDLVTAKAPDKYTKAELLTLMVKTIGMTCSTKSMMLQPQQLIL